MKKRISSSIVFALVIAIIASSLAINVSADTPMKITVSSEAAAPGSEISVTISISDNPGVTSIAFDVSYDAILTLESVEFSASFAANGQTITSQSFSSPVSLSWVNGTRDYTGEGTFATLTFTVADNIGPVSSAGITITYDAENIFNVAESNVACTVENGEITFDSHIPGDITGDGNVNGKDVTRLLKYVAGEDVTVVEDALDVNGDGRVNNKDLVRLLKYISGVPVTIY